MFAVINVCKPVGPTSHDIVQALRRTYGLKKVGHLGTLDPLASGVLPVCLGNATRLIEYFPTDKRYRAEITLGIETTTLDAEGEITRQTSVGNLLQDIDWPSLLAAFTGDIIQQVPLYSAKHVGGKKLYQHAHRGTASAELLANLPTKAVKIYALSLVSIDVDSALAYPKVILDVHCSTGTYVRSLARDIGEQLGCGAHLSALSRTAHGAFTLPYATPLEEIVQSPSPEQFLQSPSPYLNMPTLAILPDEALSQLTHGMSLLPEAFPEPPTALHEDQQYLVQLQDAPVAVVRVRRKKLQPVKVFMPA